MVNRQLKEAMHSVLRQLKPELLCDLERSLKKGKNDKMSWVRNLCVMLLTCTWIEDVEMAVETFLYNRSKTENNMSGCLDTALKEARKIGENLENITFFNLVGTFHNMSRTHKGTNGKARGKVTFNPIKYPVMIGQLETEDAKVLVRGLSRLGDTCCKLWIPSPPLYEIEVMLIFCSKTIK